MKKLLACLFVLALLIATSCCAVADEPETFTSGDWSYRVLADGTAHITGYSNSTATSIQIPDTLDGRKVTDVDGYSFYYSNNIYSAFIVSPDHPTLAVIDGVLFSKPDKRLISYPPAKAGGTYAIPQGIEIIGNFAFANCASLTSISIPNSVTSIRPGAFCDCSSLTSIPIPNSVTSIGNGAFNDCPSLTSIFIPNSVTSIGHNPFYGCEKITIELSSDHPVFSFIDGMLFSKPDKRLISYPRAKEGSACTIPQGIEIIGYQAFRDCSSLTSITIPNSVTSIEDWAFYRCRSLTSISIPDSVTSIGKSTFYECSSLTSISLPDSITSISGLAFFGCSSLTNVSIPNSVTSIGEGAFCGCSLTSISIPDSVTSIGNSVFSQCSSLTSVSIPDSVTSIDVSAFWWCPNLTLTVGRDSYAEQFAKNHNISYTYKAANDWLTK